METWKVVWEEEHTNRNQCLTIQFFVLQNRGYEIFFTMYKWKSLTIKVFVLPTKDMKCFSSCTNTKLFKVNSIHSAVLSTFVTVYNFCIKSSSMSEFLVVIAKQETDYNPIKRKTSSALKSAEIRVATYTYT